MKTNTYSASKSSSSKLKLSLVTIALTCCLYGPSISFAKEQEQINNTNLDDNTANVSAQVSSILRVNNSNKSGKVEKQHLTFKAPASEVLSKQEELEQQKKEQEMFDASYANASAEASNAVANIVTSPASIIETSNLNNLSVVTNATSSDYILSAIRTSSKGVSEGEQHLLSVTNFANVAYTTMVNNPTTDKYLSNRQLSASSTFPLRLITKLRNNSWQAAPFMPVPTNDVRCYYAIPSYREPKKFDAEYEPVTISANQVSGDIDGKIVYEGDVNLLQVDRLLKADKAVYNREKGTILTEGNISINSPSVTITSRKYLKTDLVNKKTEFTDAHFQMNGSVVSANAEKTVHDGKDNTITLDNLSFTTCPVGDNSWYINSSNVVLDQNDEMGSAKNSVLYIKDVPVMYLPYATFPITNNRRSGLLFPSLSISASNGLDYEQPIYFNIAPNYDYTLTPRYMSHRGLLLKNELRLLPFPNSYSSVNFDYIHDDRNWDLSSEYDDNKRYMMRLRNITTFKDGDYKIDLDYQHVRKHDYDYLNDIGFDGANVTDDHLAQSFKTSYNNAPWSMSLELRDYQRLLPDDAVLYRPFATLPRITANYYNSWDGLTFDVSGELTKFSSSSDSLVKGSFDATRIHFEPDLTYLLFNSRGTEVTAKARGFFTYYKQDNIDLLPGYYQTHLGFDDIASSKFRNTYLLQLKAKTTLERKVLDLRHTQTLEPEISYQYIPYRYQDDIVLYDSTDRMSDYYSNFSYNHFIGRDRIADLNSISFGLTSRLLDAHDRELLRFGISQTYSFDQTQVTLNPNDSPDLYPRSPISMFFNAAPTPEISMHANFSYNSELNYISSWNAMTEYRNESGLIAQVSYRFADDGNRTLSNKVVNLRQLGLSANIPLGINWRLTGAVYHDLEQEELIDTKVALKYEECCWSLSFVYEHFNKTDWDDYSKQTDHRIGVFFEFKGLGSVKVTGEGSDDSMDTHLLNYFNPTNLSQ